MGNQANLMGILPFHATSKAVDALGSRLLLLHFPNEDSA
jgi:hypothetical protein